MTHSGDRADTSFWVDLPAYQGSLEKLAIGAQRGEIDLAALPVAEITGQFRRRLDGEESPPALSEVADFVGLAARLVALKASALLPDSSAEDAEETELDLATDAGRRLAEYRLFKAAVDTLLSGAAEEGIQSFLGLVVPEVVPVERLRIPPERLVAALRAVVERLSDDPPLPLGMVTFSVAAMTVRLRERLSGGVAVRFEDLFAAISTRLEAVACFLALLELLNTGAAQVEQREAFGPIMVTGRG